MPLTTLTAMEGILEHLLAISINDYHQEKTSSAILTSLQKKAAGSSILVVGGAGFVGVRLRNVRATDVSGDDVSSRTLDT